MASLFDMGMACRVLVSFNTIVVFTIQPFRDVVEGRCVQSITLIQPLLFHIRMSSTKTNPTFVHLNLSSTFIFNLLGWLSRIIYCEEVTQAHPEFFFFKHEDRAKLHSSSEKIRTKFTIRKFLFSRLHN